VRRLVVVARGHHAAADFRCKLELTATVAEELADVRFTQTVVVGGVDEGDARVEHGVEDVACLVGCDLAAGPDAGAANLHGPEAEARDLQVGAAEWPYWKGRHELCPLA